MDESSDDDACAGLVSSGEKEKFSDLLDKMKLTDKYPQKLSLRDAMTIRQGTLRNAHTTDQLTVLPYLILQKMMMCDQRCRSCLYKESTTDSKPNGNGDSDSELSDADSDEESTTHSKPTGNGDSDSELSNADSDDIDYSKLHPVDCMLTILHCCDNFLRQDLISKLSLCQLAIPFLLPDPIDGSVTFLLWAMRSLFRGWKCQKTGGKEHRIVNYRGPIVSFLRISNSESSKSEILNAVIGEGVQYFFTHKECEGGDYERHFVDGLVELCCYFPSGKEKDFFTDAITFLNLRGDAQQQQKQVRFLQKISYTSVVLITDASINENTIKILQSLAEAPGGIVVLLAEDKTRKSTSRSKIQELLRQALPKGKSSKIKLKGKNIATLRTEIQQILAKRLNSATPEHFKAISDCCHFATEADIRIDEDYEGSKVGKQYAEMVMKKVHSVNFNEVKNKMIPLQGPLLWHQWAIHDKEQHRHAKRDDTISVTKYNEQKDKEKMEVRRKQLKQSTTLTPVMENFMEFVLETNVSVRKYFLQWLKLFLDDHSRRILPKLLAEYQKTRDELNVLKQKYQSEENSQVIKLKDKQKLQNEELVNASFGLEHLFRELGQIFEARMDCGGHDVPQALKDKVNCLPQIMAEIMDEGHALELMDGDASHVPTLWVQAVIEKLKIVCGRNAREKNGGKIFVLSVLGVQSTGKSTLLNTMFGLRFNVSAGRCTRGAYIQLLPLDDSLRQMIDCDYVLIVDTEGLRAPELQLEGFKHDNELATFVIGLADATIINIFGETPGDLDDILQTALHAFIRMRKVQMNPSCLFVHQNVPDALASSKSMMGRQKFHNKLDNMTQAAAKIENCEGQYNSFNQVIDFDDGKDVFYFPSLWRGDPPMAPVNIGYSEAAEALKTALIELTQRKQTRRCSLETFKVRVNKLWEAVLQENFVFSFKNTLEVFAYNELDCQYAKWSWTLQSKMLEWENTTKWKISNCDSKTEGELAEVADTCLGEAKEILTKTHTDVLKKMELFLSTSDHSETLSQWKHKTEQRVKRLFDENEKQAINYCDDLTMNKVNFAEIEKLEENNNVELNTYIKDLVDTSWREGREQSDDVLKRKFELKWEEWMAQFEKKKEIVKYPSDHATETATVNTLRELLQGNDPLIICKLSDKPLNQRSSSMELSIDKKAHLTSKGKSVENDDVQKAIHFTKDILLEARTYLDNIQDELKPFNPSFAYEVLKNLFSSVDDKTKLEKHNIKFIFTPEYKVDVGLVVCAYASKVFKQTTKKIKQNNDPIVKLNEKKDLWLEKFKNKFKDINAGKQAAINLCGLLTRSIKEAVKANLGTNIVDVIRKSKTFLEGKRTFKIQILEDLAIRESSDLYETYIKDIPKCFRYWIKHHIEDFCRSSPGTITNLAKNEATKKAKLVSRAIENLCAQAAITDMETWIKELIKTFQGALPLTFQEIKNFIEDCDIKAFSKYIHSEFSKVEGDLLSEFSDARSIINQLQYRSNSPEDLLYNDLIGCPEMCPFCKEQCYRTSRYHSGCHEVSLHRPQCLGGYGQGDGTDRSITVETCSESRANGHTFYNYKTKNQTVSYNDYKIYYSDWNIPNYSCGDPKYWKWVVNRFEYYVVKWAGAQYANIPPGWKFIGKSEAIHSLNSIY